MAITGLLHVGSTLNAVPTWELTPTQVTYQWFVNGAAVPGATTESLSTAGLTPGDRVKAVATASIMGYQDAVAQAEVTVVSHDPGRIAITKRAWVDVPPTWRSNAGDVMAHGTEVASGSTLIAGTEVYWTYQVDNPSTVPLVEVSVADSAEGQVCALPTLGPTATATCLKAGSIQGQ
jgi:hypothetical protein